MDLPPTACLPTARSARTTSIWPAGGSVSRRTRTASRRTAAGSTWKGYTSSPTTWVVYHFDEGKVLLYEDRGRPPYGLHGFDSGNAFYGAEGYMVFSRRGYF